MSLFLSLVLIVGLLSAYVFAGVDSLVDISDRVSALNTMNGWQDFFGPDKLSTEFDGASRQGAADSSTATVILPLDHDYLHQ